MFTLNVTVTLIFMTPSLQHLRSDGSADCTSSASSLPPLHQQVLRSFIISWDLMNPAVWIFFSSSESLRSHWALWWVWFLVCDQRLAVQRQFSTKWGEHRGLQRSVWWPLGQTLSSFFSASLTPRTNVRGEIILFSDKRPVVFSALWRENNSCVTENLIWNKCEGLWSYHECFYCTCAACYWDVNTDRKNDSFVSCCFIRVSPVLGEMICNL